NPSGSCLPDGMLLRQAEDLLPALPVRVARFRFGDTPLPGTPWQLVELLGDSPYSETWKARPAEAADSPTVVLKFFTESWAARILRNESLFLDRLMVHAKHPHIVPLRQIYLNSEHPCLEYEYLPAADLAGVVHDWNRSRRRPHPVQIAQIILRLAKTLAFAHRLTP